MTKENTPISIQMTGIPDTVNNKNLLTDQLTRSITKYTGGAEEYPLVPRFLSTQIENELVTNSTNKVCEDIFVTVKTPEPIEIFSANSTRTKRMREIESTHGLPGETIKDILERLYFGNKFDPNPQNIADIARFFGCNRHTIKNWMAMFHIPTRSRKESVAIVYSKSLQKDHIIASAHSAEANKKRRETLYQRWAERPPQEKEEILRKGHQKTLEQYERQRQKLLGQNPQARLQELVDKKLSYREIGIELGLSEGRVKFLLKKYSLKSHGYLGKGHRNPSQEDVVNQAREAGIPETLTEREYRILEARFPIGGNYPVPLRELGNEYGVTRQAIRKLQSKVIQKLQRFTQEGEKKVSQALT